MSLEFHPVEISRACFVGAFRLLHHHAFQALADSFIEEKCERFGIAHDMIAREHEDVISFNGFFKYLHAFNHRFINERRPVFVQEVKHEGFQRHFFRHLFDVMFSPPPGGFLEWQKFFRSWIVGEGFCIQNNAVSLYLLEGPLNNFREHM